MQFIMKKIGISFIFALLGAMVLSLATSCDRVADGEYTLHLLTTNDVHGNWFDSSYTDNNQKRSLFSISYSVNHLRDSVGEDNVILVDGGDCLQGDNAAFMYNYVDTVGDHLFARLAAYMKYDAVTVGNHDIETGHAVYDAVKADLEERGIPFLGGNAIKTDATTTEEEAKSKGYKFSERYFDTFKIVEKGGLKVAILGYSNPNMKAWLDESIFGGMYFVSLIPLVQQDVDKIRKKYHPQVVIVAVHSGTGNGDGSSLESQGLDLFKTLKGVDFLICSHDHRQFIKKSDTMCLINSGSHAKNIGHGILKVKVEKGKIASKELEADLIPVKMHKVDTTMRRIFRKEYLEVRAFTNTEIGTLVRNMRTRDAYQGMSDYVNFIHTVSFWHSDADISIAAPLTFNKEIEKGTLVYNDLFTIYPFENQMFVINMTGKEVKDYLEQSYDQWVTRDIPGHVLKIQRSDDLRNSQNGWSFIKRSYNFDSAGGINYTVDISKPMGQRINILSMASGEPFKADTTYKVAMTSYRASGGGELLDKCGIVTDKINERIVQKYPEYREIIYQYIQEKKVVDPDSIGNQKVIGHWEFVPKKMAQLAVKKDMDLLFPVK